MGSVVMPCVPYNIFKGCYIDGTPDCVLGMYEEGRYAFVYARLYMLHFVIIGLYNPPHTNMKVLKEVVLFMAQYPNVHVICMGDFHMLMDPAIDRYGRSFGG